MNVTNCPDCGKVFRKILRNVCDACFKLSEDDFTKVYNYVRKNQNSTIAETSHATDVPAKKIIEYVKSKRLVAVNLPNFTYDCGSCGMQITRNTLCSKCSSKLQSDWSALSPASEPKKKDGSPDNLNIENITYHSKQRLNIGKK